MLVKNLNYKNIFIEGSFKCLLKCAWKQNVNYMNFDNNIAIYINIYINIY